MYYREKGTRIYIIHISLIMERTDEYHSAAQVFQPAASAHSTGDNNKRGSPIHTESGIALDCKRVYGDIRLNDDILSKISKS